MLKAVNYYTGAGTFCTLELDKESGPFAIRTGFSGYDVAHLFRLNTRSFTIRARFSLESPICSATFAFVTNNLLIGMNPVDGSFRRIFEADTENNVFGSMVSQSPIFIEFVFFT